MEYGFNLSWEELDEELKEEKIDLMIQHMVDTGEYESEEENEDPYENQSLRKKVIYYISTHFPIYF